MTDADKKQYNDNATSDKERYQAEKKIWEEKHGKPTPKAKAKAKATSTKATKASKAKEAKPKGKKSKAKPKSRAKKPVAIPKPKVVGKKRGAPKVRKPLVKRVKVEEEVEV